MAADGDENERWKEIEESMGRCQTAVCREEKDTWVKVQKAKLGETSERLGAV